MFGITNQNDALTLGSIIGAAVLVVFGRKLGDALRTAAASPETPMVTAAANMIDKDLLARLVAAMETMASVMTAILNDQKDKHRQETDERLERIEKAIAGDK